MISVYKIIGHRNFHPKSLNNAFLWQWPLDYFGSLFFSVCVYIHLHSSKFLLGLLPQVIRNILLKYQYIAWAVWPRKSVFWSTRFSNGTNSPNYTLLYSQKFGTVCDGMGFRKFYFLCIWVRGWRAILKVLSAPSLCWALTNSICPP